MTQSSAKPRTLRPRGEVRALLLEAATELFAEGGYAGTSTREIAEHANVAVSLLHRHFESKAQLFEEAVVGRVAAIVDAALDDWERRPDTERTVQEEVRFFAGAAYDILDSNRKLILTLIADDVKANDLGSFSGSERQNPIEPLLERLTAATEADIRDRGLVLTIEAGASVRLMFAMLFSVTVLESWIFPPPHTMSRDEAIDRIARLAVDGMVSLG